MAEALVKQAIEAHEELRAEQPKGLTGKQALDRKTELQRTLWGSVSALGDLDTEVAADGLVQLLVRARNDGQLRTRVIGALRKSTAPGIAARIVAEALDLGVELLAVHRDPASLPALEAMIAEGEKTMPRHWCIAVCVAASHGHAPSRERLGELFGNPKGLKQAGWLRPMLSALLSGDAADTWEFTAPVREALVNLDKPRQGWQHMLVSVLSRVRDPDPRWVELAMPGLAKGGNYDHARLVGRFAKHDEALRDRLFELGTPMALHALVTAGDQRARDKLIAKLDGADLWALQGLIRNLLALDDPPRTEIESAVVGAMEEASEFADEELEDLLDIFKDHGFTDGARVDALLAAVKTKYMRTDAPRSKERSIRKQLNQKIEALRPKA